MESVPTNGTGNEAGALQERKECEPREADGGECPHTHTPAQERTHVTHARHAHMHDAPNRRTQDRFKLQTRPQPDRRRKKKKPGWGLRRRLRVRGTVRGFRVHLALTI